MGMIAAGQKEQQARLCTLELESSNMKWHIVYTTPKPNRFSKQCAILYALPAGTLDTALY